MKQIGGEQSALYALSAEELARLTQAVALGLLPAPGAIHPEGTTGALVRFTSPAEARRAQAHIA